MNTHWYKKFKFTLAASLALLCFTASNPAQADEAEWVSFTMDNDSMVGNDNGYTNGIYVSWFNGPDGKEKAAPGFLARAMMWSMPSDASSRDFSISTVGQTMITPDDIEDDPPLLPPDDLPYAGLLFYADTFATVNDNYADKVTVTVGIVGEYSFAEEAQEFVHEAINSDEPCCWDTQQDDEIVFQFSRARFWRSWVSSGGSSDLLLGADANVGTLSSSAGVAAMIRYGTELRRSYATALLAHQRTANPVATQGGWNVFLGARAGYLANHIFLDGNTYDDDAEELDYTEETVGVTLGASYSWKDIAVTFAINDLNVNEDDDGADEYSEYGTLTVAWNIE